MTISRFLFNGIYATLLLTREVSTLSSLLSQRSFSRLVSAALHCRRPLALLGRNVHLTQPLVLNGEIPLTIEGPGIISGNGHSLIQISGNRQILNLEKGLTLLHCGADNRQLKRETGAAIFARGKANIFIKDCSVSSEAGFGLWVVQKASVELEGSVVEDCGRSGVVLFGFGSVVLDRTTVRRCILQGICARGDSEVSMSDVIVEHSGLRGIYAYHNSTVVFRGKTVVRGTQAPFASAVHIESLRPGDKATLRCYSRSTAGPTEGNCLVGSPLDGLLQLVDNAGSGLSVSGNVAIECDTTGFICSKLSAAEQLEKGGMEARQGEAPVPKN